MTRRDPATSSVPAVERASQERSRRWAAVALAFASALPLAAQAPDNHLFDSPVLRTDGTDDVECQGDVDGDGDVDLVAFTPRGNTAAKLFFRVLFNDGAGHFTGGPSMAMPADSGLVVELGDVTGDGLPDLVASALPSGPLPYGLLLYRNTGGGAFAPAVRTAVQSNVTRLLAADDDADGRKELVVVRIDTVGNYYVEWFAETATGLVLRNSMQMVTTLVGAIAPADLDQDGRADLALTAFVNSAWHVVFLRNSPTGFQVAGSVPLPAGFSMSLLPGDWDLDGDPDVLLATSWTLGQVTLTPVYVQGPSTFVAGTPQILTGMTVGRSFAGDLDGDGDLDLTVRGGPPMSPETSYLVARIRNEGGTFLWSRYRSVPQTSVGVGAGFVDLDGDARPDFADVKSIWFTDADSLAPEPAACAAPADWDGDGDLDSVALRDLRKHDGAGSFVSVTGFLPPLPPNEFYAEPMQRGDFDGDGAMEILAPRYFQVGVNQTYLGMRCLEADGDDRMLEQGIAAPLPAFLEAGLVDDLDGDGLLDVLDAQGAWLRDGAGIFSLTTLPLSGFRAVAKGDFDGDGDSDFLAVNPTPPSSIGILTRTGPVQFTVTPLVPPLGFAADIQSAVLADLDDDGDLDVVVKEGVPLSPSRTLLLANTGGVFTPALNLPETGRYAAGDVDGDGLTDLVIVEPQRFHVRRRTNGGIQYAPDLVYAFSGSTQLADLDQDGDADFVGDATLLSRAVSSAVGGLRRQYGTGGLGLDARRPLLSAVGPIRTGQQLSMRVRRALGGTLGLLVFSTAPANVPNVLPGLDAYVASIDAEFGLFLGGAPGQAGLGGIDASFQLPPGTAGVTVYSQFVALDAASPIGLVHSNGVELRIGQ